MRRRVASGFIAVEIAGHMLIVDAIDDHAARFYEHLGFEALADDPSRLIRAL